MTETDGVQMRERILQEAARLFVRAGYHAISMREIAAGCGISKAALYYHFQDKEALLLELFAQYLDDMDQLIQRCQAQPGLARGRITQLVHEIFAQPVERRSIIRLANQEMASLSEAGRARLGEEYFRKFIGPLQDMLQVGVTTGEFRPMDVHHAVWVLLGMMYPFFNPSPERTGGADQAIQLMLGIFFDGVVQHE